MSTLGTVSVDIRSNTAKFVEGINSANKKLDSFSSSIKSVGVKLALLVGAAGFGAFVKASLDSGDALAKQSDTLDIATEKLAAFNYQAKLTTDAGINTMSDALLQAEKRLGEFSATGSGTASKWLEKFGYDIKELNSLSPDELFKRYADSISRLNTRGEQLSAISDLMGRSATTLAPLITKGAEAMLESEEAAKRLGIALSRADLAKFEEANDAIFTMGQAFAGVGNQLALFFAPIIKFMSELVTDFVVFVKDQLLWLNNWLSKNFDFFKPIELDVNIKPKGLEFDSDSTKDKFESELNNLRDFLKTKEELEREAWDKRFQFITDNGNRIDDAEKLWFSLHIKRQEEIEAKDRETAEKRRELEYKLATDLASIGTNLSSIFKDQSKKAFKVHQGFAILESTINSYQAFTKALAQGGMFGYVAAAAVLASGIAKVHSIASMSPSGGGSSGAGGGQITSPISSLPSSQVQQQQTNVNVIINLDGEKIYSTNGLIKAMLGDKIILETENGRERIVPFHG